MENLNDFSFNIYALEGSKDKHIVVPIYCTRNRIKDRHVHVLHFFDESHREEEEDLRRHHFASIRSLSRLCASQLTKQKAKLYFCDYCLNYLPSLQRLENHEEQCANNKHHVRVVLPNASNEILRFRNFHKQQKLGIAVYADFETLLCAPTEDDDESVILNRHRAYSVGYYVKSIYHIIPSTYKFYRQKDEREQTPSEWFMNEIIELLKVLAQAYENAAPLNMSEADKKAYTDASTTCHICEELFKPTDVRVVDHDHINGQVRGAAHQFCNLAYRSLKYISVVFHNLSCFDMHLLCRDTARNTPGHVKIIAENKEKYIALIKYVDSLPGYSIHFVDSYRFLPASLQTLASYITDFSIVEEELKEKYTPEQIQLLKQKGIFCYEYCDSLDRFDETELLPIEKFYSCLSNTHISAEEYEHAQRVWKDLEIPDLGVYSDVYLQTDCLLLAQIFETFRDKCLAVYLLDALNYFTLAGE